MGDKEKQKHLVPLPIRFALDIIILVGLCSAEAALQLITVQAASGVSDATQDLQLVFSERTFTRTNTHADKVFEAARVADPTFRMLGAFEMPVTIAMTLTGIAFALNIIDIVGRTLSFVILHPEVHWNRCEGSRRIVRFTRVSHYLQLLVPILALATMTMYDGLDATNFKTLVDRIVSAACFDVAGQKTTIHLLGELNDLQLDFKFLAALSVLQAPSNIQKILNLEHYLYQARQEAVAVTAAEPEPEAKAVAVGPSPGGSGRAAVRGRGGVRAKMAIARAGRAVV
eukprot:g1614.t1